MIMTNPYSDAIKKIYGLDKFLAQQKDRSPSMIHGLRSFESVVAPDYVLTSRQSFPDSKAFIETYRFGKDSNQTLTLTGEEFDDAEAAIDGLAGFLANCMAPVLPNVMEKNIKAGDIGFTNYGDVPVNIVFVRGNILARAQSSGKSPVSVQSIAESMDQYIQKGIDTRRPQDGG